MDSSQVKMLLDKYWQGETSLEEERQLKTYFRQDDVPDEVEQYRPLFHFFDTESTIRFNGAIEIPGKEPGVVRYLSAKWVRSIAAAVLLALGVYFFMVPGKDELQISEFVYEDTFESPELAYEEAKKALYYLSGKMNKGVATAANSLDKMKTLDVIVNAN